MSGTSYCCRKCRTVVFKSEDIMSHDAGGGQTSFEWKKRSKNGGDDEGTVCSSYFLGENVSWMDLEEVEGKLNCPKCKGKLGSYNWSGDQCSCGAWITPAIQIGRKMVDAKVPGASALPNNIVIRQPRVLPRAADVPAASAAPIPLGNTSTAASEPDASTPAPEPALATSVVAGGE
eukprot:GFYU01014924.1.p1 GENE.GFYU01014924.1~~GFYU01014924.1.p1  ORF type:complete len:176 (+),score=15.75 GFYU01014924.1:130-657(+)